MTGKEIDPRSIKLRDLKQYSKHLSCLYRRGFRTLGEVADSSAEELLRISSFGKQKLNKVQEILAIYNLALKEPEDQEPSINEYLLGMPVSELEISGDLVYALERKGITTIYQLCCMSRRSLINSNTISYLQSFELNEVMEANGLFYRPDYKRTFLYLYPDTMRQIIKTKPEDWRNALYMEAFITNYKWMRGYREKTDRMRRVGNVKDIRFKLNKRDDVISYAKKKLVEIHNIEYFSDRQNDEKDEHELIESAEKLARAYRNVITWKLSLQDYKVADECIEIIDLLGKYADHILRLFDTIYEQTVILNNHIRERNYELDDDDDCYDACLEALDNKKAPEDLIKKIEDIFNN